jgi:hypothetical protein
VGPPPRLSEERSEASLCASQAITNVSPFHPFLLPAAPPLRYPRHQGASPTTHRAEPLTFSILLWVPSDSRPLVWYIIGLVAGIFFFIRGLRLLQRRHLILDTPVSKIRSASLGMVELSGLAIGPYTMVAPVTERPCFYYRTVAWEWKRQGRSSQWVKVAAECMYLPFFLDDNTGKVLVDPRGAELDLHRDFQAEFCDSFFTLNDEAPGNVRSFLFRHGVSTTNKIKVEEFSIKPKNGLFLLGTLHENPGLEVTPEPTEAAEALALNSRNGFSLSAVAGLAQTALSFVTGGINGARASSEDRALSERLLREHSIHASSRVSSTQVIHLSSDSLPNNTAEMTQQQKIAAALLKAGIASPAAWAAAGVRSSALVFHSDASGSEPIGGSNGGLQAAFHPTPSSDGFDPHPPIVMMKGKNNPTFVISWRSQRDLARSLRWKCALMTCCGAVLSLLCLYGLHTLAR